MNMVLNPHARLIAVFTAVISILLVRNPLQLILVWLVIGIPLVVATRMHRTYFRFLGLIVIPLSIALFIVWGFIMGAKPGDVPHSSPRDGAEFALLITLRLILLGTVFQVGILSLGLDGVGSFCAELGLPQDLRIMVVGATILVPEMKLRASQVFTARCARGLLKTRGMRDRARQLPGMLRALVVWALRSALDRTEMWNHRKFFDTGQSGREDRTFQVQDYAVVAAPTLWLIYNIMNQVIGK